MTHPSEEEVRGLVERLRGPLPITPLAGGGGAWDTKAMAAEREQAADALESQQRAYLALSERVGVMERALDRIAKGWGHCSTCQTPCEGCTECSCSYPNWAPDEPCAVARAALTGDKQGGDDGK